MRKKAATTHRLREAACLERGPSPRWTTTCLIRRPLHSARQSESLPGARACER